MSCADRKGLSGNLYMDLKLCRCIFLHTFCTHYCSYFRACSRINIFDFLYPHLSCSDQDMLMYRLFTILFLAHSWEPVSDVIQSTMAKWKALESIDGMRTCGASICECDVRKILGFFNPFSPPHHCHCHKSSDCVPFVCFLGTPLPPPTADVIYRSPLVAYDRCWRILLAKLDGRNLRPKRPHQKLHIFHCAGSPKRPQSLPKIQKLSHWFSTEIFITNLTWQAPLPGNAAHNITSVMFAGGSATTTPSISISPGFW